MMKQFVLAVFLIVVPGEGLAQQPQVDDAPVQQGVRRPRFDRRIELGPDDKPGFADPPADFRKVRDDIAHGKLEMIRYDGKEWSNNLYHFAQRLFRTEPARLSTPTPVQSQSRVKKMLEANANK